MQESMMKMNMLDILIDEKNESLDFDDNNDHLSYTNNNIKERTTFAARILLIPE